ncbi:MAG: hypothetical protein QXO86_05305 [Nitrososphaerota archaeon]
MAMEIGVFGAPRGALTGYLDRLRERFNAKLVFSPQRSEREKLSGLILLDAPSEEWLLELAEDGLPTLIEIPFAASLQEEAKILKALSEKNRQVIIPLYSRHNPKLLRLSSLVREGVLGKACSIYVTAQLDSSLLREEPSTQHNLSGEIVHQLINTVDFIRSLERQGNPQYRAWLLSGEVLTVDARVGDTLVTVVSQASRSLVEEAKVCIEAVGSENILVWDGTEHSLQIDDGGAELRYWGLSLNDVLAQHFFELAHGMPLFSPEDIYKSYHDALKLLGRLKAVKARR